MNKSTNERPENLIELLDYRPATLNVDIHQVGPLTAVQIGGPTHVLPLLTLGDVPTNNDMVK